MRVIFFGTAEFAVPSLEQLADAKSGQTVVMCVTQPDRPQGRGLTVEPSPVKRAAAQRGLPLMQPARLQAAAFEALKPDVGVVAAYGQLIPRELLSLPTGDAGRASIAIAEVPGSRTRGLGPAQRGSDHRSDDLQVE
jgi:methionyl-tRNA formyltransferase